MLVMDRSHHNPQWPRYGYHGKHNTFNGYPVYASPPNEYSPANQTTSTFNPPDALCPGGRATLSAFNNDGIGLGLNFGQLNSQSEVLVGGARPTGLPGSVSGRYGFPPTPRSSDGESAKQLGSARSSSAGFDPPPTILQSNADIAQPGRAAKSRKSKPKPSKESKGPALSAPLSELTKHMTQVPMRDMEAWVNRSIEDRHKEVEARKGRVTRPMNSFMLYRSAYAERTKAWCAQNNHQVVSSLSGESWPLEPPAVREKFNQLASTERTNHAKAHPTYKFSPSKIGSNKARRKKDTEESEPEDIESRSSDEGEWYTSLDAASKRRKSLAGSTDGSGRLSPPCSPFAFEAHRLSYPHSAPLLRNGPMLSPNNAAIQGAFYDNYAIPPRGSELTPAMMQDMRVRNVPSPALMAQQQQLLAAHHQQHIQQQPQQAQSPSYTTQPLASVPGSAFKHESHDPYQGYNVSHFASQLDPGLIGFNPAFTTGGNHTLNAEGVAAAAAGDMSSVFSFDDTAHSAFADSIFEQSQSHHYEDMLDHPM